MTGSETNPTVFITVSENAVDAHEAHGDEPAASEADCEALAGTPVPGTPAPGGTPVATPVS